jgi:hypothetical protein
MTEILGMIIGMSQKSPRLGKIVESAFAPSSKSQCAQSYSIVTEKSRLFEKPPM